jgi:hypothetical protein
MEMNLKGIGERKEKERKEVRIKNPNGVTKEDKKRRREEKEKN